jgi:hypothetical protein
LVKTPIAGVSRSRFSSNFRSSAGVAAGLLGPGSGLFFARGGSLGAGVAGAFEALTFGDVASRRFGAVADDGGVPQSVAEHVPGVDQHGFIHVKNERERRMGAPITMSCARGDHFHTGKRVQSVEDADVQVLVHANHLAARNGVGLHLGVERDLGLLDGLHDVPEPLQRFSGRVEWEPMNNQVGQAVPDLP